MTITLTRDEAQQVLDALVFSTPSGAGPAEVYKDAVVLLQDRLEQPDSKAHLQFSGLMHVVCKCDKCKAQPEPEPVAKWEPLVERRYSPDGVLLSEKIKYTPDGEWQDFSPQREWQGLTDEEAKREFEKHNCVISADLAGILARAIEAKLREKNS